MDEEERWWWLWFGMGLCEQRGAPAEVRMQIYYIVCLGNVVRERYILKTDV